jgi:hypothetical protein
MIVQDLAPAQGPDIPGIEFQAHDMFHEQPVKGLSVSARHPIIEA